MDKVNKVPQVIVRIICIICIILSSFIIFSSIFNKNKVPGVLKYKPVVVQTKTTVSSVKKGDLIIIKDVDISEYKKEDVIVYKNNDNKNILAKVQNIETKDGNIVMSIDKNSEVSENSIQGIKVVRIPLLGYIVMFLQTNIGIIILAVELILSFVWYKTKTSNKISD